MNVTQPNQLNNPEVLVYQPCRGPVTLVDIMKLDAFKEFFVIDLFYGYELDDLSLVSKAVRQALKGMSCLFPGDHPYYDAVVAPRVIDDFSLRVVEYWCRPSDLKRNPFQKWLHTLKRIRIMHDCRAMSFDDIVTTLGSVSHLEFVELWLFGEFDSNYVLDVSMLPKSLKQLDLWLNQIPLQGMKYPDNLQSLKLVQCDKLEVLDIPATLRNLTITGFCGGLDPFSNNLTHFKLQGCEISGVLCLPPNTREIIIERTEVGTLVFDGCTPSLIVFIDNDIGQIKAANGASIPEYLTLWPEYSEHQFAFGSARHDRRFRDEQYWCHTFGPVSHEYKEYDYMSIFSEKNPREAITLADILSFEFAKESSNVLFVDLDFVNCRFDVSDLYNLRMVSKALRKASHELFVETYWDVYTFRVHWNQSDYREKSIHHELDYQWMNSKRHH